MADLIKFQIEVENIDLENWRYSEELRILISKPEGTLKSWDFHYCPHQRPGKGFHQSAGPGRKGKVKKNKNNKKGSPQTSFSWKKSESEESLTVKDTPFCDLLVMGKVKRAKKTFSSRCVQFYSQLKFALFYSFYDCSMYLVKTIQRNIKFHDCNFYVTAQDESFHRQLLLLMQSCKPS